MALPGAVTLVGDFVQIRADRDKTEGRPSSFGYGDSGRFKLASPIWLGKKDRVETAISKRGSLELPDRFWE